MPFYVVGRSLPPLTAHMFLISCTHTLYITEPVCYVICCNCPATVRPLPAIWHGRVCTAGGRGLVPSSRVWDGTAPRGPAGPQGTVSPGQRRMWGEYIHVHSHVYTYHTTCMGSVSSYNHAIEPHKIFNPPPQFSRLGIQVSLAISLFVWAGLGGLPYLSFSVS